MKRALVAFALILAAPAPAAAASFGELPFRPVSEPATCLRATGVPGELVRWVRGGAELMTAGREGLAPGARVPLGRVTGCPEVAAAASGAAVLAAPTADGFSVALREPGDGRWSAPVALPADSGSSFDVAIAARGDAVLAWTDGEDSRRSRLVAARRPAGGGFGRPEVIVSTAWSPEPDSVSAGMAGDGETVLAFSSSPRSDPPSAQVVAARPGASFGRATTLGSAFASPALAVAGDGRALVGFSGPQGIELFERAPGGEFAPLPGLAADSFSVELSIALGQRGAAVVAWQDRSGADVAAVVRDGLTAFGAPVEVSRDRRRPSGASGVAIYSFSVAGGGGPPVDWPARVQALLTPDGRALLAWDTEGRGVGTATVTSRGRAELGTLGSGLRNPTGLSPLVLADGSRAIAWADERSLFSTGARSGRLHLALEGAAGVPAPAPPRVTAGTPRRRALRPAQPLVLPIRCSAACDVRASLPGDRVFDATGSLAAAGRLDLRIDPLARALDESDARPLRIRLTSGAPGARDVQLQTVSVRLRQLPAPPLPRFDRLRVRRSGDDVVVHVTTDGPMREAYVSVLGLEKRSSTAPQRYVFGNALRQGRRRFRVVLRDAAHVRYVQVAITQKVVGRERQRVVRVPFTGS